MSKQRISPSIQPLIATLGEVTHHPFCKGGIQTMGPPQVLITIKGLGKIGKIASGGEMFI